MNIKNVLVSGATGFFGSYILEELIKQGFKVIILKRSFSNTWRINHLLPKIKCYDIDKVSLVQIFQENVIDVVIHTATLYGDNGERLTEIINSNTIFPLEVLEISIQKGVQYFINMDTFYTTEMELPSQLGYYVFSKKHWLDYAKKMCIQSEINFINLKIENIYGPRENKNRFIPFIINKILNKENKIDLTKGEQIRDFIHVKDAAKACLFILNNLNSCSSGFFETGLGSGNLITIHKLVLLIKKKMNSDISLNFGALDYRKNEIMDSHIDISFFQSRGWKPQFSIEEGITDTLKYYLSK